jgi:hypothetical protein
VNPGPARHARRGITAQDAWIRDVGRSARRARGAITDGDGDIFEVFPLGVSVTVH